ILLVLKLPEGLFESGFPPGALGRFKSFPVPSSRHRCARTKSGGNKSKVPPPARQSRARLGMTFSFLSFRLLQQMFGLGVFYSLNFTNPPNTVATTLPCSCQPSKGEFLDLECESVAR